MLSCPRFLNRRASIVRETLSFVTMENNSLAQVIGVQKKWKTMGLTVGYYKKEKGYKILMVDFPNHELHARFSVFDTVVPSAYLQLKFQYLINLLIESIFKNLPSIWIVLCKYSWHSVFKALLKGSPCECGKTTLVSMTVSCINWNPTHEKIKKRHIKLLNAVSNYPESSQISV
jgi:hypothetical protein